MSSDEARSAAWWAAPALRSGLREVLAAVNLARDTREARVGLDEWIDGVFDAPSRRLAVYGTLAPGEENHHVIAPAGGTWQPVTIEGAMGSWGRYPVFEWISPGEPIPAMLIESETLPSFWARLDAFETDHYARHLVPCITATGELAVTNCYVRART